MTATTQPAGFLARSAAWRHRARLVVMTAVAALAWLGAAGSSQAAGPGGWTAPLAPLEVVHEFAPPAGPYAPGHRGVDLAGLSGQPVHAAAAGVVSFAGQVGGIGVVSIAHGPIRTTYQPLWDVQIPVGTAVDGGDVIGVLGGFGTHCAPAACLHWGALRDDTYVDPLALLDPGPSRLLPYWDEADRSAAASRSGVAATRAAQASTASSGWTRGTTDTGGSPEPTVPAGRPSGLAAGSTAEESPRALPPGLAAGIAMLGGVIAGAVFLAVRRRRG